MQPPAYFEPIRGEAAELWDTLEEKPSLAAPWRQLFHQIQSPRHVLSELLQNADDAEASEAWVGIDASGTFFFEHDGKDFTDEQFRSLCRFGYSNKRNLFTIGFRGIGFKSTFSLGSPVSILTPTLSVAYHAARFTEPVWDVDAAPGTCRTRITVRVVDKHRGKEIERNFADWLHSPLSLLFFRHIRRIHIGDQELHWQIKGDGPVKNSKWMALGAAESKPVLIVRSEEEAFPPDALEEIHKERMVSGEIESEFPPCAVELVLGDDERLFVVLPTGGDTGLPFCGNAPFMLTPDREHIKSPAVSPTNRWLLDRMGRLAATAMLDWLANENLSLEDRAMAYDLMPTVTPSGKSADARHGEHAAEAFGVAIDGKKLLLTDDGLVVKAGEAIHLPQAALDTWGPAEASKLLDDDNRPALYRDLTAKHRQTLFYHSLVARLEDKAFLTKLSQKNPPRPDSWHNLLVLWKFVHGKYPTARLPDGVPQLSSLRIVPVAGSTILHRSDAPIRVTSRPEQCRSEYDWEFLTSRLLVTDDEWLRFVANRNQATVEKTSGALASLEAASKLLADMEMAQAAGATRMIDRVAKVLLADDKTTIADWVRLAQISAALGAAVGKCFRYVTRDDQVRSCDDRVIYDLTGDLERILPSDYAAGHLLHSSYETSFVSCSPVEWKHWIESGDSGLADLPGIEGPAEVFNSRPEFETRLLQLQTLEGLEFKYNKRNKKYKAQRFRLIDFDFPADVVRHWMAMNDPTVWALVAERLLLGTSARWNSSVTVIGKETRTDGSEDSLKTIPGIHTPAAWLRRMQTTACLPDKHGVLQIPSDLLRRTPETEPLLDVESFVDARLDTERSRDLLDALGVGSKPHGPDRLLDCLAALALAPVPPVLEVTKWYLRLDQFTANCPETDLSRITVTFTEKKLVLSEDGAWCAPPAIYLNTCDDDAPGAPLVMDSVRHLRLWGRIGVADRPTVEMAIAWIKGLPSGKLSDKPTLQRVEALLKRHPIKIWSEVERWLDLAGRWVPVENLDHAMAVRQCIAFSHLHEWVKQRVADFRLLAPEVVLSPPFAALPPLEGALADRLLFDAEAASSSRELPWLTAFGEALGRIELDDPDKTTSARETGRRLVAARIRVANSIRVIQYFGEKPAGTERQQDIAWVSDTIFIVTLTSARLARLLPESLARTLPTDLREALCYCYERSVGDVARYMEENFTLVECADAPPTGTTDEPAAANYASPAPESGEPEPPQGATPPLPPPAEPAPEPPTPEPAHPSPRRPSSPGLLDRFAQSRGFKRDGDGYQHPDGSSIIRRGSGGFPWQLCHPDGGELRDLRAIDACLERRPIVLAFEIWAAIENRPDRHSLILLAPDGQPVEVTGSELCRMRQDGLVSIFPAAYRLKHQNA